MLRGPQSGPVLSASIQGPQQDPRENKHHFLQCVTYLPSWENVAKTDEEHWVQLQPYRVGCLTQQDLKKRTVMMTKVTFTSYYFCKENKPEFVK